VTSQHAITQSVQNVNTLQNTELSLAMKCSTISASGLGKQVTSLQQLDEKMPKSQRRARNDVSGKKSNYLVWGKIIF